MKDLLLKATRQKYRFGPNDALTVEDLWDIPLTSQVKLSLDKIAVGLNEQMGNKQPISFVNPASLSKDAQIIEDKFNIVKGVIDIRVQEQKAAQDRQVKAQERQRLLAILERKQDEELNNLSQEDIAKRLAALEDA